jgi:hypothetical protein
MPNEQHFVMEVICTRTKFGQVFSTKAELLAEAGDYLDDEVSRQNRITIFVCECDNRDSHVHDDEFPE